VLLLRRRKRVTRAGFRLPEGTATTRKMKQNESKKKQKKTTHSRAAAAATSSSIGNHFFFVHFLLPFFARYIMLVRSIQSRILDQQQTRK